MDITREGQQERIKAGFHLALFGLAAVCSAYNGAALASRPTKHLAFNLAVYTGLCGLEAYQVFRHLRSDQ